EEIFSDEEFNCRGFIAPSDVVDLARDIASEGLLSPIVVQPAGDVTEHKMPRGKFWRIIAGHRRYAAMFLINKTPMIPCIVRTGLNPVKALILNLGENNNRKSLNILQEARALERLKNQGLGQTEIAQALKVPRPWVQTRF